MSIVRIVRPTRAVEWTGSNETEVVEFVEANYGTLISHSVDGDMLSILSQWYSTDLPWTSNIGDYWLSDAVTQASVVVTPTEFAERFYVIPES